MGSIEETVNNINNLVIQEAEAMLYDDYFSDENDLGVEVEISHKGKLLPFRLKKSLTLAEKQRASDAAVEIKLDKDGNPTISRMDQSAYTREIILAGVLEWPFKYSEHRNIAEELRGRAVPINRYSVSRIDGILGDKIAAAILGQREVQQKAIDPFDQKSDVASSRADHHSQD